MFEFLAPFTQTLVCELISVVVDMEPVTVEAQRETTVQGSVAFTKDLIDRISTGGDPVQVAVLAPGIKPITETANVAIADLATDSGIPYPEFIVRGLPSDSNLFYFDYIRVPTLFHNRGIPTLTSIIPSEALDKVEISKGGYDVSFGPGLGGLFQFLPKKGRPEKLGVFLNTSLANADLYIEMPLASNITFLGSVRKSLYDFTYQPMDDLIFKIMWKPDYGMSIDSNFGDFDYMSSLILGMPGKNSISFDVFGLYDYNTQENFPEDIAFFKSDPIKWMDDSHPHGSPGTTSLINKYFLNAQGLKVQFLLGEIISNKMYAYHYAIDASEIRGSNDWVPASNDFLPSLHTITSSNIDSYSAGDSCDVILPLDICLRFGFDYSRFFLAGTQLWQRASPPLPLVSFRDLSVTKDLFEADGWLLLNKQSSKYIIEAGIRDDYFSMFNKHYLSARGKFQWNFSEQFLASVAGGMYPSGVNYLRVVDGLFGETKPTGVAMNYSCNALAQYTPDKPWSLDVEAYGNYINGMNGYCSLLSVWAGQPEAIPDSGITAGIEAKADYFPSDSLYLSTSYNLAYSYYHIPVHGWVPANSDVRHALGIVSSWKPIKSLNVGANARIQAGVPFTPMRLILNSEAKVESVYGLINSARDYMPRFFLDVSFSWDFKIKGKDAQLFIDVTNLVNGPMLIEGFPLNGFIGWDSADPNNRTYKMNFINSEIAPVFDFGFKIKF